MHAYIYDRWFVWPNLLLLSPIPLIVVGLALATWRAFSGASQAGGFLGAVGLFAMSYLGIAISLLAAAPAFAATVLGVFEVLGG